MARQRRMFAPGSIYHVMNRGNHKEAIFKDDFDRVRFEQIWVQQQRAYAVKTQARSLMGNHFHGVVETEHANLDDFMEQMQGQYARYWNRRHKQVGHLFQRRYIAVEIQDDIHLLTALCYVFMNPLAAGLVKNLQDYKWSSYAATAGFAALSHDISIEWLTTLFPAGSLAAAQRCFRAIMSEPYPVVAFVERSGLDLESETVRRVIETYTGSRIRLASLPRLYRTSLRPTLAELVEEHREDCGAFVREARVAYGYRNAEIATLLGVSPSTVSNIFTRCHRPL